MFIYFFSRDDRINPTILEYRKMTLGRKLKVIVPFLSDEKDWRAISPFPMSFVSQFVRSKFWDSYLVQSIDNAFGITYPPPPAASGEKAFIYGIFLLFTFGICYWEIYNFLGGGGFVIEA